MADNSDQLTRFLLGAAHTRGAIIRGSSIVQEAAQAHGLTGIPAKMFGENLLASILLLSSSKGGVRQVLQLDAIPSQSHAPIQRMLAEACSGSVRGYLNWMEDGIASHRHSNEVGISTWMGKPIHISTIRDLGMGQPYVSTIQHDSDYLADHIVHYLNQSVQIHADVILLGDLAILLEAMPGCDDERWFQAVKAMASISNDLLEHGSIDNILKAFDKLECKIVGHDEYAYHCNCSIEKMSSVVETLNHEQLQDLADKNGDVTVTCQYCSNHYSINIRTDTSKT